MPLPGRNGSGAMHARWGGEDARQQRIDQYFLSSKSTNGRIQPRRTRPICEDEPSQLLRYEADRPLFVPTTEERDLRAESHIQKLEVSILKLMTKICQAKYAWKGYVAKVIHEHSKRWPDYGSAPTHLGHLFAMATLISKQLRQRAEILVLRGLPAMPVPSAEDLVLANHQHNLSTESASHHAYRCVTSALDILSIIGSAIAANEELVLSRFQVLHERLALLHQVTTSEWLKLSLNAIKFTEDIDAWAESASRNGQGLEVEWEDVIERVRDLKRRINASQRTSPADLDWMLLRCCYAASFLGLSVPRQQMITEFFHSV